MILYSVMRKLRVPSSWQKFILLLGACPLLCGGHGDYVNGECECHPGWKGRECSLRHDECEVSDCSGRGHCQDGKCICMQGFAGEFCENGKFYFMCTSHHLCIFVQTKYKLLESHF